MGAIYGINVDGKEIMPDLRYNIVPQRFVHRGSEGFSLRKAADEILNQKKEIEELEISENKEHERRKREREEIKKKREEYYEKHMKDKTVDWLIGINVNLKK